MTTTAAKAAEAMSRRHPSREDAVEAAYDADVDLGRVREGADVHATWLNVAIEAGWSGRLDDLVRAADGLAAKPMRRALAEHPMRLAGPTSAFAYHSERDQIDPKLLKLVENAVRGLRGTGTVESCRSRPLFAGREVDAEGAARVVLPIVGPSFLAEDYRGDEGLADALRRHGAGEALVVPVVLRPCGWASHFGEALVLPRRGRPLALWADPERAADSVAMGLRIMVGKLRR